MVILKKKKNTSFARSISNDKIGNSCMTRIIYERGVLFFFFFFKEKPFELSLKFHRRKKKKRKEGKKSWTIEK